MPELGHDHTQYLDDELARFTDRLLAGEPPDTQESAGVDTELLEMQKTAARLNHAFGSGQPDRAMADRVRANLASEWSRVFSRPRTASVWRNLRQGVSTVGGGVRSASPTRRIVGWAFAAVVLIALVLLLPLDLSGELAGSAGQQSEGVINPVFLVGGLVVLGGVVWWLLRSKR